MLRRKMNVLVLVTVWALLLTGLAPAPVSAALPSSPADPAPVASSARAPQVQEEPAGILTIPTVDVVPEVDGKCTEYTKGVAQKFTDGNGQPAIVYLLYSGGYLYACMDAQPGTFDARFGSFYLDPQGDGSSYVFADKGDHAFHVGILDGKTSSYSGTGVANGWTLDTSLDALWNGASSVSDTGETVEWRLSAGRLRFDQPCQLFGVAVYHHWFSGVGDDYGWPSNKYFDQPRTWQLARIANPACADRAGRIAYVFRGDTADATSFYNLLTGAGYSVTLVPLNDVLTTDFTPFTLVIVADDSGDLNNWGLAPDTAAQVAKIRDANIPIIGLGEGGYAFFGQMGLFIGWPNGWHGPQKEVSQAPGAPSAIYTGLPNPVPVYGNPVNSVGIFLGGAPIPADVIPVGLEVPTEDHASLIMQSCRFLWGGSGNPLAMLGNGKTLFLNVVQYMNTFQCPPVETPPQPACVTIEKTAVPADGTPVKPGDIIEYTVTYTFSDNPDCNNPKEATLVDTVPPDTVFVPGSASGGVSPGTDGALHWAIHPAAGPQTKTFKVVVSENQCADQRRVNNRAAILIPGRLPVVSNVVSHPVDCPAVGFPNNEPMFAEGEISIHPYPLILGHPSTIQVKVSNNTGVNQSVVVRFQTSPNKFGIGLNFSTFDTRTAVIPAHGNAILQGVFTPAASGHYCIQIVVTGPGLDEPLVTQRNIDVTEELQAGTPDSLTFKVRNNSTSTADVSLVVDNTCPGWTAQIVDPAGGVLTGMAPGEIRDATLQVTPPTPVVLGSGCHIDVQGWIGDTLIGGIRKLDVPPVQLPSDVNPPWEEPEISFNPNPPVAGQKGQICIELQNPLNITRTVTVDFSVADFGAGIPFTPVGTETFTLPPNSIDKYCTDWTPTSTGTLHRCALVTLKQDGYPDMRSQRNVDLVYRRPNRLGDLDIPFLIGNPDLVDHHLVISTTVYGIDPYWVPKIVTDPGDPPPEILPAGETIKLHLGFMPMAQANALAAEPIPHNYGDVSKVEISAWLDGERIGGVTVMLESETLFLPFIADK